MKRVAEYQLSNTPAEIRQAEEWVRSFAHDHQLSAALRHDLDLALTEWLTNVISYGHTDRKRHRIAVRFQCSKNEVKVIVTDDGTPFNLLKQPPVDTRRPLEERAVGGLGIHMIKTVMDDVRYRRWKGKNVLTLTKKRR